jgi:peptidoglycan/xylan/chitin deacetylase (PgdA/CDA1 family)
MILMYHHVCPSQQIPRDVVPLEGWQYCVSPQLFRQQLLQAKRRGWQFVSLQQYVAGLSDGSTIRQRLATVTFDDGWLDNYQHALPMLTELAVPATIFVISGSMAGVRSERRMSPAQLRSLQSHGVTVGAHSCTHPQLTALTSELLRHEVTDCRSQLQDLTGTSVDFFAYPGGRFNRQVVQAVQQAGFTAACSVIGMGVNSDATKYWLYRDAFTEDWRDWLRLTGYVRRCCSGRAARRARQRIEGA